MANFEPSVFRSRFACLSSVGPVRLALVIIGIALWSACDGKSESPAPPTYPVTGQLVSTDSQVPVGAAVEFKPEQNEDEWLAAGVTDADGRFELSIALPDRMVTGATAGPHRVVVQMPIRPDRTGGERIAIDRELVVQPGKNHFEITIPGSPQ